MVPIWLQLAILGGFVLAVICAFRVGYTGGRAAARREHWRQLSERVDLHPSPILVGPMSPLTPEQEAELKLRMDQALRDGPLWLR